MPVTDKFSVVVHDGMCCCIVMGGFLRNNRCRKLFTIRVSSSATGLRFLAGGLKTPCNHATTTLTLPEQQRNNILFSFIVLYNTRSVSENYYCKIIFTLLIPTYYYFFFFFKSISTWNANIYFNFLIIITFLFFSYYY